MSKYSITATKKDYQYAFDELLKLEKQLKENLNWKKIKRVKLDELVTLIGILKRKLPVQAPAETQYDKMEKFLEEQGVFLEFPYLRPEMEKLFKDGK